MRIFNNKQAFILIYVLWVMAFLTVLVVQIGLTTRQRMTLMNRLEDRQALQAIADAGVKKAMAILVDDVVVNEFVYTMQAKMVRHNNPAAFNHVDFGDGRYVISYQQSSDPQAEFVYGVVDEESKININTASPFLLQKLIEIILPVSKEHAKRLAQAIIDWRGFGESNPDGFYSDSYYSNLKYPYKLKNAFYERIDELLLVRGITQEYFAVLEKFLTVFGDGRININTTPIEVLLALGLSDGVIGKIVEVRNGADGVAATADDHIFQKTFDVPIEMRKYVKLTPEEMSEINLLNEQNILTTDSFYYMIKSRAKLTFSDEIREVKCVFNTLENRVEYWYEK